ncbi:mannosyltransferase putative-domain-containing protein [Cladochytrium replicatum]|nr:mannosyltransferase putative-domain-containing protein [Cladochytrium replicatum]
MQQVRAYIPTLSRRIKLLLLIILLANAAGYVILTLLKDPPIWMYDDRSDDYYWNLSGVDRLKRFAEETAAQRPCRVTNENYQMIPLASDHADLWPEEEIDEMRATWKRWLANDYVNKYSSVKRASDIIRWKTGEPKGMHGRGIIIYVAKPFQLQFLEAHIALLHRYNSTLPVEVWSFKDESIAKHKEHRERILKLSTKKIRVSMRAVDTDNNYLVLRRGNDDRAFHIKIGAILNSRFREVLAVDVDAFPMRNPEELFDTEEYKRDGSLMWSDYWKTHKDNPAWRWMGVPCVDEWEQESGMIVLNKPRTWRALHLTYHLSENEHLRWWHRFLHGDKDIFRYAWRASQTPSHRVRHWLAPGGRFINNRFCGQVMMQAHPATGELFFAHVNLFKDVRGNVDVSSFQVFTPLNRTLLRDLTTNWIDKERYLRAEERLGGPKNTTRQQVFSELEKEVNPPWVEPPYRVTSFGKGMGIWAEHVGYRARMFWETGQGCVEMLAGFGVDDVPELHRATEVVPIETINRSFARDFADVLGSRGIWNE